VTLGARSKLVLDLAELPEVGLRGTGLHPFSLSECVDFVLEELGRRRGGTLIASDLDLLLRARRDPEYRELYEAARLRIPSGMLLCWACRLQRTPLPERVLVADLLEDLCAEAALQDRSVFLVAATQERLDRATAALAARHPRLVVAGSARGPEKLESDPLALTRIASAIKEAEPDLVLVGLPSPVQERLIQSLREARPEAWWLAVGDGLGYVAGELRTAPRWMQRAGLEWIHRFVQEPVRMFRPYVLRGLPLGAWLLLRCAFRGTLPKGKSEGIYGSRMPRALLVDDDQHALDQLQLLLSSRFPDLEIVTRTSPDASGAYDFYFLDNDFEGVHLAAQLASGIRAERPNAIIVAFSGVLDVATLKRLINVGCDGVCDKAEPQSWRPILDLIDNRLVDMVERHRVDRHAFGGVRQSAYAIQRLLHEWNERDGLQEVEPPKEKVKA
jgi:N-acetylglucosaminyldiphosphoundecaprenol N-acetyl-beta-D-mannosaminyltransferase